MGFQAFPRSKISRGKFTSLGNKPAEEGFPRKHQEEKLSISTENALPKEALLVDKERHKETFAFDREKVSKMNIMADLVGPNAGQESPVEVVLKGPGKKG